MGQVGLADRAAEARSTVRWHLAALERVGLVEARRNGPRIAYFTA